MEGFEQQTQRCHGRLPHRKRILCIGTLEQIFHSRFWSEN